MLLQLAVRLLHVPPEVAVCNCCARTKSKKSTQLGAFSVSSVSSGRSSPMIIIMLIAMITELRPITSNKIITQAVGPAPSPKTSED